VAGAGVVAAAVGAALAVPTLRLSGIFLALISRTYFDSDECRKEFDRFLGRIKTADASGGRKLVPIFKHPPKPEQELPAEQQQRPHAQDHAGLLLVIFEDDVDGAQLQDAVRGVALFDLDALGQHRLAHPALAQRLIRINWGQINIIGNASTVSSARR